ncbi:PREDICTED: LRR receptor-like serine/threonine-protein kinase GSO2 [Brassica oleracea var. oleracea]|uniref:LRR receptor-like serine/threonine-protein kinase GSO2 n=1 Tax=Brassica oleracea var. oleracea TaxID=109376 RepID=UPI0006A6DAF7|nr:PREDICTED: LRR receptor-like serine/threonine-protein kinase GSO2 [Brassica oleracea var. oleracea]
MTPLRFGFELYNLFNRNQYESATLSTPTIISRVLREAKSHHTQINQGLREVDLSNNKISGNFPTWLKENNNELQVLRLQNNYLTSFQLPNSTHGLGFLDVSVNKFNHLFPENIGWILPQLSIMNISGNGFQGNLPFSLSNMTEILYLDISHNNFQGKIPRGFLKECYFIGSLKLSHNRFSGEVFPEEVPAFSGISELFMDNNQFTGNIGKGLGNLQYLLVLDISNSSLLGVIPNCIGQLPQLTALLLSNNSLEGNIPTSLFNMSNLYLLDLSANRLSGDIPPHIISAMPSIVFLQDNNLSGIIPDTLLMNVTVLDLRNNRLSGSIPEFTNIQSIGILLLRGNDLTGRIPRHLCGLRTIHLLDLANNRLNGPTPSCLGNASFGLGKEDSLYLFELRSGEMSTSFELGYALEQDSTPKKGVGGFFNSLLVLDPFIGGIMEKSTRTKIEFATKHRYDSYMGGNLELLIGMDLSENELSGEIPFGLGDLHKLHALNLSHNKLSGVVPKSFSGLKNMESLDLSFNRLQGRIPSQLAELSSLAVFNVSFNNLSGVIPQGKQFNTFDSQSFLGNPFLCGLPTSTSCYNSGNFFQEPDNEVEEDEGHINMISFYWSFAGAYVTILLEIISSLTFDSPWSRFWFYKVDVFIHKVRKLLFCN